jgi:hypothetical protein
MGNSTMTIFIYQFSPIKLLECIKIIYTLTGPTYFHTQVNYSLFYCRLAIHDGFFTD